MTKRYRQMLRNIVDDRVRNGLLVWRYRLTRPGRLSKPAVGNVLKIIEIILERVGVLRRKSE